MLFHVIPRFCANAGLNPKFVELESVEIEEIGLSLTAGVEITARCPYPNKSYKVVCKKKGNKAVEGLLVDIGDLREVTVTTKWKYFFTVVVHEVIYVIVGDDLGCATADPMRYVFDNHPQNLEEAIREQSHIIPTMTFKDDKYFQRTGLDVVSKGLSGQIKFRNSLVDVPTLTVADLYNHRFMGNYRLPQLEDVFITANKELK